MEDEEDGGAEEIEVIGFDPDLVDVIGDAESDELGVDFDELDFFEPAVKGNEALKSFSKNSIILSKNLELIKICFCVSL